MTNQLQHRRLLITGASSGIGRALCERLTARGAGLLSIGRRIPPDAAGHPAWEAWQCDFADLKQLSATLERLKHTAALDGAVLCHGYGDFGGIEEFSEQRIIELVTTNFLSTALLARTLVPLLRRRSVSDLVLLGSQSGLHGGKYGAVYSATKFALRGLAQALRQECRSSGLRVSTVNPGLVNTAFFDRLHFSPGDTDANALYAATVADTIEHILTAPANAVFDEINLSPLTPVVRRKPAD